MRMTMRKLLLGAVLFALWVLLSGHFSSMLLSLGLFSSALGVWLTSRMGLLDGEWPHAPKPVSLLKYAGWLAREIFISNLKVARMILDPALPIRPVLFFATASQQTDTGRVIFANSITLTPGTIAVDISGSGHQILVHALHADLAWEPQDSEMDARVTALGV